MKGQDNPLIPNPHPHLLNSTIKKPIIVPSSYQPKKTHKPRKAIRTTEISQSSGPINLVAYETVYKEWEDRMKRAATTASSLDAEQDSDAQTRFETTSNQSNAPPLSRGYTLGCGEDSMKLLELMELCTKLSDLIQALVDKKKVIITELSIRSDLHLEDAGGTDYLPTATIFKELARMGVKTTAWNEFSSTMASAIICLATNQKFNLSMYIFDAMLGDMSHHKKIYANLSNIKKIFANMKGEGKDFSGRTPITIQPSTSKPQKKQSRRKQKKTTAVPHPSDSTADVPNEESVPTHSNDPLLSAQEITNLKLRVKKLEKKTGLRTHKFKRLYKFGVTRRVEYSDDESLGAQEDAFNQGRSIEDIDKDAKVSLVDETHGRSDDAEMFDTDALIGNEVFAKNDMIEKDQDVFPKEVSTAAPSTIAVPPPDRT
ncbi:hypothetical protein Tco_0873310, partial [Tanacetum coccineum]